MERDSTTKFVGLDVHSKTISVAIADDGRKGEVRHYGTIENTFEVASNGLHKKSKIIYFSIFSGSYVYDAIGSSFYENSNN